jgi:signal transduction histidine kinase
LPAICFVVTDLTEHKHNEELLASEKLAKALHEQSEVLLAREQEARREAEKANRIKDEFLAMVSHELRTPLNAILGWSNLLQRREMDEDEKVHGIQVIDRNARVQLQLIEDLLDVSRIVSGRLAFNFIELDLAKIIEAAVETAHPAASAKGIHLEAAKTPDACGHVLGDVGRLQQVVTNLLSNAIKFTPAGGTVNVKLEIQPEHAVIKVADTGEGISTEFLPFVFERFRQADVSAKRGQTGLGLGLAIVRHLVELHGGSVMAESFGIGQGATFTVTLPLTTIQKTKARTTSHEESETSELH